MIKERINKRVNKRGSYVVEAAMSLPVFILVFVALAMIIVFITRCENIVFRQCGMLYEMDMKAPQVFPNPRGEDYKVLNFDYLYSENGIDDLISLDSMASFKAEDPIGINGRIDLRLNIRSRGFTGALQHSGRLSEEDFKSGEASVKVIVFPKYGIRFHREGCRYVKQDFAGEEVKLTMEKKDAELKGYTACSVCGGG